MKNIVLSIATMVVLLFQLISPSLAYADDETPTPASSPEKPTPIATETSTTVAPELVSLTADPIKTDTRLGTSTPVVTELATDTVPPEAPTPDLTSSTPAPTKIDPLPLTPTDSASPAVDPLETIYPTETSTPLSTESITQTIPSESLTPDLTSSIPVPTVMELFTLTPTDLTSPTMSPVETNISIEASTPLPTELVTELIPTESATPDISSPTPVTSEASTSIPTQENTLELIPSLAAPIETDVNVIEQSTLLETAQTISDDISVVVLDANGQALPLASQEAAQAITNSDPVWCPVGQAPTPGLNGCTIGYATLADLAYSEVASIAADGIIWITSGPVADAHQITIDGAFCIDPPFPCSSIPWSNYALTLQGGWSGINGDTSIGSNSVFSVPIEIINWNNNITVNNISVGNITTPNLSGTAGIQIQNNGGSITINNSNFNNNSVRGARLTSNENITINNSNFNNNYGETFINSASLTIDNSNFNNSIVDAAVNYFGSSVSYFGAFISPIYAIGNVNISNSSFSGNSASGFSAVGLTGCSPCEYQYNITINNSNFNNNSGGAGVLLETGSGNYTINNSNFNNNLYGAYLVGNGVINGSIFSGNHFGASIASATGTGTVTLNDLTIDHNAIGLELRACGYPALNMVLNNVVFSNNALDFDLYNKQPNCPLTIVINDALIIASQGEGEFALDCASVDGYSVNLPNSDRVQIFCPVSGRARISRLDNTALPAALPAGYTYASGFSLDILQNKIPIPVITEGGYVKASFTAPSPQEGDTYSILYWDNGTWIPLKDFLLDENGNVHVFDLDPGDSEDTRKILSGVRLVTQSGSPRVEVSTNFLGIFVLAQH